MHSDEDILRAFEESKWPVLGTQDIADAVGFGSKQGAYKRLEQLVAADRLRRRVVGGTVVYWLPD